MNILFYRLDRKVNCLFPLFVFFSLMGKAINVSELTTKITRGKKKKNRLNGEQSFESLYILFGLQVMSNIYYTEFQRNEKQGPT